MSTASSPKPPSSAVDIPKEVGDFKLIVEDKLDFADISIAKWQSQSTGFKVVWASNESPLVQGYASIVSEIFDDSGRPHTLEHLVFLGSENYPYKGILDTIANRSFASGTNAWTATTDTTYTVATAGEEGFLQVLPVYLEHVFYPTLTKEGFTTEVYHINGKGEDSGVVYSEMNGRENGSSDLMQLRLQRTLYSKENALRSETGGLMEALRVLKVEEIREFHGQRYVPQNVTLIVNGRSLNPTNLLNTLTEKVIPAFAKHGQAHGPKPSDWVRPFVESSSASHPPLLKEDKVEVVDFPSKDLEVGELMVSWIGVKHNDFVNDLALEILGLYLTDSAVSPLSKEFIEVDQPSCTDITFYSSSDDPTVITTYISSVPYAELDTFSSRFRDALARIATKDGIDMERMQSLLDRQKLQLLESMETDASDVLCNVAVSDGIWGKEDGSDLKASLQVKSHYAILDGYSAQDWSTLMKKFLVDAPALTIVGKPSAELATKIKEDTKARVEANKQKFGEEGLAKLQKELEHAQAENDKPIPPEILRAFPIPDVNGIEWINVETAHGGPAKKDEETKNRVQEHVNADGTQLPLSVQFDHVNSAFVQISLVLFPTNVAGIDPVALRALLPIYIDSFFTLPITRADGTELEYEEVVKQLDAETLSYSINIATPLQEGVTVKIKVAKEKYALAIGWLRDLLYGSTFSVERLKITAAKALQAIPAEKRDGGDVSYAAYRQIISEPLSTNLSMNLLNRADFLPAFVERIKTEPEAVVKDFEAFRTGLTDPRAMRVQVKGDILSLDGPASTFVDNFKAIQPFPKDELVPVKLSKDVMGPLGKQPAKKAIVYGLSSIESSFAYHAGKGPNSSTHEDQPALTVARAVLNAMEGFLWKYIRGAGLAYGASISQDVESGIIYYRIYKSPDSHAAFVAARNLIDELVSGKLEIDDLTIESAKSSLAYDTASKESTINDAATASFTNSLLGRPANYGRIALANTKNITATDILHVIKKYIAPLFRPASSIASIASGLAKQEEIAKRFEELGYDVERRTFESSGESDESGSESGSGSEYGSASGSESE